MSDYGDMCRDIRDARREARTAHGIPCPRCAEVRPKAHPSILLPEQRCKVDGYRDPRKRTRETEYLTRVAAPDATSADTQPGTDGPRSGPVVKPDNRCCHGLLRCECVSCPAPQTHRHPTRRDVVSDREMEAEDWLLMVGSLAFGFLVGVMLGVLATQDPVGFTCTSRDVPTGQCQTWERSQ